MQVVFVDGEQPVAGILQQAHMPDPLPDGHTLVVALNAGQALHALAQAAQEAAQRAQAGKLIVPGRNAPLPPGIFDTAATHHDLG